MNIFKLELKFDLKRFIFWSIGIFLLLVAGMTKFKGFSDPVASADLTQLIEEFPKIILAMMGMANVDIQSLGGYFFILQYYVLLCIMIYSIHLGSNAVLRENFDKTYEFVFTKPRKRSFILSMKLLSSFIYLFIFSLLNLGFSFLAFEILDIQNSIQGTVVMCSIAGFLVGLIFLSLSACISSLVKKPEKGTRISYLIFLFVFVMGIVFDISENAKYIKIFTPLKYFEGKDLVSGMLDPLYIIISVVLSAVFIVVAFTAFNKKDLNAV